MSSSIGNDDPEPKPGEAKELEKKFKKLKDKVLQKRPVLEEILRKRGSKNLLEYASEYIDVNLPPTIPRRQNELLDTMNEMVTERFGKNVAESVIRQLKKYYFVSTADHTGPIIHPFFVNSDLLIASTIVEHADPDLENIIVLSCANISTNNSSFPRGLFFENYHDGKLVTHRLPFLSANPTPHSIYRTPSYRKDHIQKSLDILWAKFSRKEISENQYKKSVEILEEIYLKPEVLNAKDFGEQVGKTNFEFWPKFFSASDVKMPNLIYLEQESLVVKLLTKYHLYEDTILNHLLFDEKYEPYINDYFENIFGSFSRENSSGTYLFWALPDGARDNLQLWRKGKYLVSADESYKIPLEPETIRKAMESRELIPGLLLNFMTISFYYGLKCLGGFNQVNYLTLMKNAYIKMNTELGNYRSIEVCARAQTKEICDGLTFAFMGYNHNSLALASGLDLALYNDKDSWQKLINTSKNITFSEALSPILPEVYRISYDQKEWEEELLSITDKDISRLIGLNEKTKPCIDIID